MSASNDTPGVGQQIVATIAIDVPTGVLLGSFTGSLAWNPAVLTYVSNTNLPSGFTGNVNTANAGTGSITFNGANASGSGDVTVTAITFNVVAAGTSALDLNYTAMAAAVSICNMLPGVTVTDDSVTATAANHTVTFNANGGTGTMTAQTASVPTALKLNTFTRGLHVRRLEHGVRRRGHGVYERGDLFVCGRHHAVRGSGPRPATR